MLNILIFQKNLIVVVVSFSTDKEEKEIQKEHRKNTEKNTERTQGKEMSSGQVAVKSGESAVVSRKVELPKFSPEDIPSIIGPSQKVCEDNPKMRNLPSLKKNVITPAWKSFKTYQESLDDDHENKKKNPGKIFVKLARGVKQSGDQVVIGTIECDSDEMFKFIMLHLNKYRDSFKKPQRKMFYNIYAQFPQHLIPLLIGSGGSGVRELKNKATEFMDESFADEDFEKCEKSFLKVTPFEPRDLEDFLENVDGERSSFVGDRPTTEEDKMIKMIKMSVSSFAKKESFQNFTECLCDVVREKLEEIKDRDQEREAKRNKDREEDLAECMEALEQEW